MYHTQTQSHRIIYQYSMLLECFSHKHNIPAFALKYISIKSQVSDGDASTFSFRYIIQVSKGCGYRNLLPSDGI